MCLLGVFVLIFLRRGGECFCSFFKGGGLRGGGVEGILSNVIYMKTSYILSVLTPTALRDTGR